MQGENKRVSSNVIPEHNTGFVSRKKTRRLTIHELRFNAQNPDVPMLQYAPIRPRKFSSRPIDKAVIAINKDAIDATQANTVLVTSTYPCTITGVRWSLSFVADAGTAITSVSWCIQLVKEGANIPTIAESDAATIIDPEQNMLTWGFCFLAPGNSGEQPVIYESTTKSMRKMQGGDRLIFSMRGQATNTVGVRGGVQFFCKT